MLLATTLSFNGTTVAQGPMDDPEIVKLLNDIKDLAASALPDTATLGADWKRPWELPAKLSSQMSTEEDYWKRNAGIGAYTGLTREYVQSRIDDMTAQGAKVFAQVGLGEREYLLYMVQQVRGVNAQPAVKLLEGFATGAAAAKEGSRREAEKLPKPSQEEVLKMIITLLEGPFKGKTVAQLKEAFVNEATLVQRRTVMTYFRSNNWDEIAKGLSDRALQEKNVWVGQVTIGVILVDASRIGELEDLKKEDAKALAAKYSQTMNFIVQTAIADEERKLARTTTDLQGKPESADIIKKQRAEFEKRKKALQQVKFSIDVGSMGDSSYIMRTVMPGDGGGKADIFVGWIRHGSAAAVITFGGNFPEAEMVKEMDHFMSVMDASLQVYADPTPAGRLDVKSLPGAPPS
jgi:hypothetical protein